MECDGLRFMESFVDILLFILHNSMDLRTPLGI